jgi:hypothetical protein
MKARGRKAGTNPGRAAIDSDAGVYSQLDLLVMDAEEQMGDGNASLRLEAGDNVNRGPSALIGPLDKETVVRRIIERLRKET